ANKITMPILMKLLATKMVAKSFLGLSKSEVIILKVFGLFSKPFSKSVLFKENKATSAPEISAEHNNNRTSNTKPNTIEKSTSSNKLFWKFANINALKLEGSGSNDKKFNFTKYD